MVEIRVTKSDNHNPKVFTFPDLDYEDSMAMTCTMLDDMHKTNGFTFEVVSAAPIVAQHFFGVDCETCVECLKPIDLTDVNYGTPEMPRCLVCMEL